MFIHVGPITPLPHLTDSIVNGKRFYKTPSNSKYPSITTILGHEEKQAIVDWRTSLGPKKAKKETERCSARGTIVHEMVEKYLNNEDVELLSNSEYYAKFLQIKLPLNKINNIHVQEAALYSDELAVAGRVDCIGEYNGVLSIIDFKTSNNHKTKEMIFDYYLQATAYALMYYELTGVLIEKIVIIMSVEKGFPLVFEQTIHAYITPLLKRIEKFYGAHK